MSKIRTDFVTNSSSSCFIVQKNTDMNVPEAKRVLEILLAAHDKIDETSSKWDEYYIVTDTKDKDEINSLLDEYACWDGEEHIDSIKGKDISLRELIQKHRLIILTSENVIPYHLHEAICSYLNAKHFRLG